MVIRAKSKNQVDAGMTVDIVTCESRELCDVAWLFGKPVWKRRISGGGEAVICESCYGKITCESSTSRLKIEGPAREVGGGRFG